MSGEPWMGGLVLAALVAALMSSADTCLLSQGVILTQDIMKRFMPSLSERRTILLTRLNIIILGLLALGLAMVLQGRNHPLQNHRQSQSQQTQTDDIQASKQDGSSFAE